MGGKTSAWVIAYETRKKKGESGFPEKRNPGIIVGGGSSLQKVGTDSLVGRGGLRITSSRSWAFVGDVVPWLPN